MDSTRPRIAFAQYDENIWSPIPELNRTDADISLIILAQNSVVYIEPVDDPFFAAHVDSNGLYQGRNATYYFADTYFHILACAEQYQYCNNNSHGADGQPLCTDLSSSVVIERQTPTINLSDYATLTTQLFNTLLPLANIFGSIGGSGAAALRASDIIFHQVSGPLPDNQWTIEVSAWFGTALSRLQHGIVEFATGPPDAYVSPHSIENGKTETWDDLCGSIKIGDANNQQSFKVLGIGLIIAIGCTVILVSWLLEWCVENHTEGNQWTKDDKLFLLEERQNQARFAEQERKYQARLAQLEQEKSEQERKTGLIREKLTQLELKQGRRLEQQRQERGTSGTTTSSNSCCR
jgi:hypothetical protein